MAEICITDLTNDILIDCENETGQGIETNVLLTNRNDIDFNSIVKSPTNKLIVTDFNLKTGKKSLLLQGVKQSNSASFELVKKELGKDKFKHTFSGTIVSVTPETKLALQEMAEGASLVAIIEKKYKGEDNKSAFEILGLNQGLELESANWSSAENDGTIPFVLSSVDGYEEATLPHTLLETDYQTTKTAFDNKFQAPVQQ